MRRSWRPAPSCGRAGRRHRGPGSRRCKAKTLFIHVHHRRREFSPVLLAGVHAGHLPEDPGRAQRTVIGLLGVILLLPGFRHWLSRYLATVFAVFGLAVASRQHFGGWGTLIQTTSYVFDCSGRC